MKKIFKKNQVIITALAIMIAVAGYINYSDNHLGMDSALEAWEMMRRILLLPLLIQMVS